MQNLRKEQGLDVIDRIHITYQAEGKIAQAIECQRDYICNETLALSLKPATPADALPLSEVELAGMKASFHVRKA